MTRDHVCILIETLQLALPQMEDAYTELTDAHILAACREMKRRYPDVDFDLLKLVEHVKLRALDVGQAATAAESAIWRGDADDSVEEFREREGWQPVERH